ncbi:MAG: pitrilysin family protein [Candidatus Pacearchaeota archaeon]
MKFFKKKLKNGMVVIMEKRELPVVSFSITNRFGAAYEKSEIKGIAHVIEHLLFTGTKNRTHEEISREIEKKGGILNAFTDHEVTSFWFKLPSEHLFTGIDILADMLKNPLFDEKKFEKEKKVILEEIKMYNDNPRMRAMWQIEKNLFEKPFGELIIGNEKSVSSLRRDFVADFYRKNYSPENFIVTVVGNANFEKICDYLEKNFKAEGKKPKIIKIKKKNDDVTEEREGIDQANLIFAFHAPLPGTKEFYALEVFDAYFANGMSSKLFLEIREKRGLAYAVKSSINAERNYSFYSVYVGTMKEKVSEVKKIILEELKKVENMSEKDLEEAKQQVIGLRKVNSEESANVMNELMVNEIINDARDYYKHDDEIKKVKLADVKKLAASVKEFSFAAVVPK